MAAFTSSVEQLISQARVMNSSTATPASVASVPLMDLNTLFEHFDGEFEEFLIVYLLLLATNTDTGEQPLPPLDSTSYPPTVKSPSNPTTDDLMQSLLYSSQPSLHASSSSLLQQQQYSPMVNTPCLDALTPAVGCLVDSPMMTTPYLDPLIGSHFSTPIPSSSNMLSMDTTGMVLDHLDQYFTAAIDSPLSSVNPSQLTLEQYQQPTMTLAQLQPRQQVTKDDEDDTLFPPLSHEQQQQQQQQQQLHSSNHSGYENDLDIFFDDLFATGDTFPSNEVQQHQDTPESNSHSSMQERSADSIGQADLEKMVKHAKINANRQFTCELCDRGFSRRYNLGTHIKTHFKLRTKPFDCDLCPMKFDRKHDCLRHISTVHKGERLHTCHKCTISFSRRDALHRHQAQKHPKK